jgi:hypothetical protein
MSRFAVLAVTLVVSTLVVAGCSGSVGATTVPASSPSPIPTQNMPAGPPSAVAYGLDCMPGSARSGCTA